MRKNIIIIVLFALLIVIMTFPLVFKISTHLPGFFSTDEIYATMWDSWRIKHSWLNHLSFKSINFIAYPFGANFFSSGYSSYVYLGILYFLSLFTTPVLTYNLQIICNFFLSLTITYLLILYLTRSRLGALFGALAFGFSPYQFVRSWQHMSLTYNYFIPLSCFGIILFRERPYKRQAFFFFGVILLTLFIDYAISYFTVISLITLFVYLIFADCRYFFSQHIYPKKGSIFLKRIIIGAVVVLTISLPQFYPVIKNRILYSSKTAASANNPYHRPFEDLFFQSARPLSYLLPATTHPLFGKYTEQFIGTSLYGISLTEHMLYLGWVPMILAFVAFRVWIKNKKVQGQYPKDGDSPSARENFYIGLFIFLAIVAWLFSQPPWWNIFGFKLYMPSFFMYKILPMYRAYCRFGIVLMLAVAVLAGFGLKYILARFKSQKAKAAMAVLFCGAVLFEFWNWPPYKVIDVSNFPEVYSWLKQQPSDTIIAEYPLDAGSPNEMYKTYQIKHEKRIINASPPGSYANKVAQEIKKLSSPATAGILKWMGVKYALVHKSEYLDSELVGDREELSLICRNPALRLVGEFSAQDCPDQDIMCIQKTGPIDVYEVIAAPIEPQVKE